MTPLYLRKIMAIITKVFMVSSLVLPFCLESLAEDCAKAKKYYDYAVKELKELPDKRYSFEKAVELCPSFIEARLNLGKTLLELANHDCDLKAQNELLDRAAEQYEAALKQDKKLQRVFVELGKIYYLQGRYEMSAQAYKNALAANPNDDSLRKRYETVLSKVSNTQSGIVKADQITSELSRSKPNNETIKTMGIEKFTVPKDRQRFNNIIFNEWSKEIDKQEAKDQLQEIGQAISAKNLDRLKFVIEGHTDNLGGLDPNQRLSEERAESVKNFLVDKFQLDPSRISTSGFGYSRPLVPNETVENRQKNRRVEILFLE
jgi:outer membrane protein OmpA-like peptidoglycan-associated protein